MKFLLMIIFTLTLSADSILIPLVSKHNSSHNDDGKKFNEFNYGVGYQVDYNHFGLGTTATVMVLQDSFYNPMATLTYGVNHHEKLGDVTISVGAEFGIGYKKIWLGDNFKYSPIPIAFIPTLGVEYKGYSIRLTHIPEIKRDDVRDDVRVDGVTLLTIGVKI